MKQMVQLALQSAKILYPSLISLFRALKVWVERLKQRTIILLIERLLLDTYSQEYWLLNSKAMGSSLYHYLMLFLGALLSDPSSFQPPQATIRGLIQKNLFISQNLLRLIYQLHRKRPNLLLQQSLIVGSLTTPIQIKILMKTFTLGALVGYYSLLLGFLAFLAFIQRFVFLTIVLKYFLVRNRVNRLQGSIQSFSRLIGN